VRRSKNFIENKRLPFVWYTTIAGQLNVNKPIWMGVDIDLIGAMATSVKNYYKVILSSTVKLFDFKNSGQIDKLVDKIMPTVNSTESLGEWAAINNIRQPIPMNKIFEAFESGDMMVYNAPNVQRTIKSLGFDRLTCLEMNSLTCFLWNTNKIKSVNQVPKP
jgi:hypothetical protein